ncbi:putative WD40/YVTN repeat-like-containing domain superfamily [Septoria linicola]|nr:putative WD40/YVTN repeat-like-containing domain superfamily [Septoria linicola]
MSYSLDLQPRCVGSTGDDFNASAAGSDASVQDDTGTGRESGNYFRKALFTPDGTSIITQNADNCLRTFVLPTDLLDDQEQPKALTPYAAWRSGSNIQSCAIYPGFDLRNPATTFVLAGSANVPVTLRNALGYETVQGSYPLVHPTTEEHQPPRSLAFTRDGTQFLVGSESILAAFDCSQFGEGPTITHKLRPGRKATHGLRTLRRKGFVSAMSISNDGLLAIGTNEREVALYENEGLGAWISSFELEAGLGTGVSDLKWSPCGRYLLVAERQSNVIQVYDVRDTQQKIADLTGRYATTPQTLNIDVVPTASGCEVWGGGSDGVVRMWSNPGAGEGDQTPSASFKLHDSAVASVIVHPVGAVMATASGERATAGALRDDDEQSEAGRQGEDCSLKVWTV